MDSHDVFEQAEYRSENVGIHAVFGVRIMGIVNSGKKKRGNSCLF